MAVPPPKDNKASASAARGERSAEALARAALANLDADRPVPVDVAPRPAEVRPPPAAVDAPERHVATLDPPPQNAGSPPEAAPPRPESQPHQDKGLVSFLKRMPDLLRPGTPSFGEAPRPPMPVGTPPSE